MALRLRNLFKVAEPLSYQRRLRPKSLLLVICEIWSQLNALSLRFVNPKVVFYFTYMYMIHTILRVG